MTNGIELIKRNIEKSKYPFFEVQDQKGNVLAAHLEDNGTAGAIEALEDIASMLPPGRYNVLIAGQADTENQRVKRVAGGRSSGMINALNINTPQSAQPINGEMFGREVIEAEKRAIKAEYEAEKAREEKKALLKRIEALEEKKQEPDNISKIFENPIVLQVLQAFIQPKGPINEQQPEQPQ